MVKLLQILPLPRSQGCWKVNHV